MIKQKEGRKSGKGSILVRECNLKYLTDIGSPGVVVGFSMSACLSFTPVFYLGYK